MKILGIDGRPVLFWKAPSGRGWKNEAVKYVVYKFANGDKEDIGNPAKIVAVTTDEFYEIPEADIRPGEKVKYAVTALDRMSNESKPKKKSIKY